jgi:hypothetical protein
VERHAALAAADRPLLPALFPVNQVQDEPQPDPPLPAVTEEKDQEPDLMFLHDVPLADMVSQVEAVENCHDPVYESVI